MRLTDEQLAPACRHYGITIEEGRRRHEKVMSQGDDPARPICIGCAKWPAELQLVAALAAEENLDADEWVRRNEGTFNDSNGHFLCDECYIKNGSPSSPRGWVCP